MNYTKPEVAFLGDATSRIQAHKTAQRVIDLAPKDEAAMSYDPEE